MLIIVCCADLSFDLILHTIISKETDKEYLKSFGQNIQKLRKKLGISQEELAYRAGFHRTYVGMIERGERNITLSNLKKLAQALELDIKDLF